MSFVLTPPAQTVVPVADGRSFPVHRVYCVGRNYVEHAVEMGHTGREPPFFFLKPADAVLAVADGQTGQMAYPSLTANLHHEIELVVAIGRGGRNIAAADAAQHIWGYGIGLDMTRRDLQNDMKKQGRPWCIGKAFEQSAPIGPIHPIARSGRLGKGAITLHVNGAAAPEGRSVRPDLERRRDHRAPQRGLAAAARRPDLHRHASRCRLRCSGAT